MSNVCIFCMLNNIRNIHQVLVFIYPWESTCVCQTAVWGAGKFVYIIFNVQIVMPLSKAVKVNSPPTCRSKPECGTKNSNFIFCHETFNWTDEVLNEYWKQMTLNVQICTARVLPKSQLYTQCHMDDSSLTHPFAFITKYEYLGQSSKLLNLYCRLYSSSEVWCVKCCCSKASTSPLRARLLALPWKRPFFPAPFPWSSSNTLENTRNQAWFLDMNSGKINIFSACLKTAIQHHPT